MPKALENAHGEQARLAKLHASQKYDANLLGGHIQRTRTRVVHSTTRSTSIKFVDVGARWVDIKDRKRRTKAAIRRSLLNAQRKAGGAAVSEPGSKAEARERVRAASEFKANHVSRLQSLRIHVVAVFVELPQRVQL